MKSFQDLRLQAFRDDHSDSPHQTSTLNAYLVFPYFVGLELLWHGGWPSILNICEDFAEDWISASGCLDSLKSDWKGMNLSHIEYSHIF